MRVVLLGAAMIWAGVGMSCGEKELDRFDATAFREPSVDFRPWVRWWWPGGEVQAEEVKREVGILASAFFGGAEIQAMDAALPKDVPGEVLEMRLSVHTPRFYQVLAVALEEARRLGLKIDLTFGSGWPPGGMHVGPNEAQKTLLYAEKVVEGPGKVTVDLAGPDKPLYYLFAEASELLGTKLSEWMPEHARLEAVLAAKVVGGERSLDPLNLTDQVMLEVGSVQVLTERVGADRRLVWDVPEGKWVIVGVFSQPDGMKPLFNAEPEQGFVVDHFDAEKVRRLIEKLIGGAAGLDAYFGNPLRALFVDSLELKVERFWASDFFEEFKKRRGYDVVPLLPVVFVPGADNNLFDGLGVRAAAPFRFDDRDEKVQYDWQRTASELFLERFVEVVRDWAEAHGMGLRMQAYGANIDVIGASGRTTIPEAEQLYAGGADMFLKLVASGAHLYGRSLISAEALVWMLRDHAVSPAVMVAALNKLFAAGVNHVVYHGFPYRRMEGAGEPGWHPFSSPWGGTTTYSENISETNPFWQDIIQINRYVARCQQILRAGRPEADVLIYYPFLGFPAALMRVKDWGEPLFLGKPEAGGEAILPAEMEILDTFFGPPDEDGPVGWLRRLKAKVEALEAEGWAWDFVNEESLRVARVEHGNVVIRGQIYKAIVLFDTEAISDELAEHLRGLARDGVAIVISGDLPSRDVGNFGVGGGDEAVRGAMAELVGAGRVAWEPGGEKPWSEILREKGIEPTVWFGGELSGVKHVLRRLEKGGLVLFLVNSGREETEAAVEVAGGCVKPVALDPWTGEARPIFAKEDGALLVRLPAYGVGIVLCGVEVDGVLAAGGATQIERRVLVEEWVLWVVSDDVPGGQFFGLGLGDWSEIEELKYSGGPGVYRGRAFVEGFEQRRVVLDLGWVEGAAEVRVNGVLAGRVFVPPFRVDITGLVRPGENEFEVVLWPPKRNRYVGLALAGKPEYAQFGGGKRVLATAGLLGPVEVRVERIGDGE